MLWLNSPAVGREKTDIGGWKGGYPYCGMAEYLVKLLHVTRAGDHMSANLPPLGVKYGEQTHVLVYAGT